MFDSAILSDNQLSTWQNFGYFTYPNFFKVAAINFMRTWIEEIKNWPNKKGKQLNYYEMINGVEVISRTENFLPFHKQFNDLITNSKIIEIMSFLHNEPSFLFKDKINYKYPGTGKYNPHQDIHAYDTSPLAFQHYHLNCAIFVDSATIENGCFELCEGNFKNTILPRKSDGSLQQSVIDNLNWVPLELESGSIVIFDTYLPHRSERNMSKNPRRSIFLTFNGASKGNLRKAHYEDRASNINIRETREINTDLFIKAGK